MAAGLIQVREDARTERGRILPGAIIHVKTPGGQPAEIFQDAAGLVPLQAGQAVADAEGLVSFFARRGSYVSMMESGGRFSPPKELQAGDGMVAEMPEGIRTGLEFDNSTLVTKKHDQIRDAGGGVMQMPPGALVWAKDGWHPSVHLRGADKGGTKILAPAAMTPAIGSDGVMAVMRILARAPGTLATEAWYTVIQDCTINARAELQLPNAVVDCVLFESAPANDPDYALHGGKAYGAGALFRVETIGATRYGIRAETDRQRLYTEGTRALYNADAGLSILSNDPVIGPRCGFGNNGGHQISASGMSGFMGIELNVWGNPATRSESCLAMNLFNVNGITLVGTNVLNDTLSIRGTTNAHKAVVVGGIDFRPMDELFTDDGVVVGDQAEEINTFIRVRGYRQLIIGKNGYSRAGGAGHRFKHVLTAQGSAACHFDLVANSDPLVRPWASAAAVPILVEAGSSVWYDYLDLATGVRRSNITPQQD